MTVALRRSWAKDLDAATLYELLKLRVEVFVVEQACAYPELDGRDLLPETRHFWLQGPRGEVICTLRLDACDWVIDCVLLSVPQTTIDDKAIKPTMKTSLGASGSLVVL